MISSAIFTRPVICVVLLTFTSACSTTQSLTATDSKSLIDQISVGDKIEVERKDGSQVEFEVTEVSSEGLRGRNVYVPFTDIGRVQIRESMHPAVIALLVLLGAVTVYMLREGTPCGNGPWDTPCDEYYP